MLLIAVIQKELINESHEKLSPIKCAHTHLLRRDIKFRKLKNCEEILRKSYFIIVNVKELKVAKPV